MSGIIDKNVVQMVFDSAGFLPGAENTLSVLDKLKSALNFKGAVQGLENIGNNVKNIGMDGLYAGVYKVQDGFNVLDIVATRVIQNITDRIQGSLHQLAGMVITQPLKDGFEEYQLQMDSVQTITASTGEAIGTVNGYLDELNEYADRTIYSFSDMTANIGKFTNAGVSLDKAVAAIQGVSNVAAVSGANTNEASRAMYNFAQALSAGSVKLIDWKSIENANMATVEFKQELINTALAMGTLTEKNGEYVSTTKNANGKISDAFTATKNFNDSLQAQWMTTDVLVQTLNQYSTDVRDMGEKEKEAYKEKLKSIGYTDEQIDHIIELAKKAANAAKDVKTFKQLVDTVKESLGSGWTKTWQYIFGDLNEAKVLWTGINDVISGFIDKTADARNEILETWHKSGYTYNKYGELVKAFYDSEGKIVDKLPEDGKVYDRFGKEVKDVVDEETNELVPQIIKNGKMVREEMGGRDLLLGGLQTTYKTFSRISKQFSDSFNKNFLGVDNDKIKNISLTGEKLIDLSSAFYDVSNAFKKSWASMEDGKPTGKLKKLREVFDILTQSLRKGYKGISGVFSGLGNAFGAFLKSDFFKVKTFKQVAEALSPIADRIKSVGTAFKKHFGGDKDGLNKKGLIAFFNALLDTLQNKAFLKLDFFLAIFDALGSVIEHLIAPFGTFSQLLGTVGGKWSEFMDAINSVFNNSDGSKFEAFFMSLADSFNGFINTLKDSVDFSAFSDMFDSIINTLKADDVDVFGIIADAISSIVNVFKAFLSIAAPVAAAFAKVFGPFIHDAAVWIGDIFERINKFTESLIANSKVMKGIQTLFEGVFSVIRALAHVVMDVLIGAWDSLAVIFNGLLPTDLALSDTLKHVGDTLKNVAKIIESLVSGDGAPKLSEIIKNLGEHFVNLFGSVKDINPLDKLHDILLKIGDGIKHALGGTEEMSLLDTIVDKLKNFLQSLKDMISDESGNIDFVKLFEAGGIGFGIKKLIDLFKELKSGTGDLRGIFGILGDFKEIIENFTESLGDKFKADSIKAMATSMLEIAGAMFILSMIDSAALAKAVAAMVTMFRSIERMLVILNTMDKGKVAAGAGVLTAIGTSMLELSIAISILGKLDAAALVKGLAAVTILLAELTAVAYAFSKFDSDLAAGAGGLVLLAIALDLLIIPVKVFSKLSWEELGKGLGGVTVLLIGLVIAVNKMAGKTADMVKAGFGILLIAEGIKILAKAVVTVSGLSWEDLGKGLAVFAVALIGMVGAAKVISDGNLSSSLLSLGAAMLMLGTAMNWLAMAGLIMATVSWESLGKMAAVLAGALIMLGVASWAINGKNLLMIAGAIALVATAFLEFNAAVGLMEIIGPLCTSVGYAITGMSKSLEAFARHEAARSFLQFLEDAILFLPKLAVALAQAIISFVVTLGSGAAQLVTAVVNIGKAIIQGLGSILGDIIALVGQAIRGIIQEIITTAKNMAPQIIMLVTTIGRLVLRSLTILLPDLFRFLETAVSQLIQFIVTVAPRLYSAGLLLLEQFISIMTVHMPILANLGMQMIISFINGLATAIDTNSDALREAIAYLITSIVMFLLDSAGLLFETAFSLISSFVSGIFSSEGSVNEGGASIISVLAGALFGGVGQVVTAALSLMGQFVSSLISKAPQVISAAGQIISKFVTSIKNKASSALSAGAQLVAKVKQGITNGARSLYTSGVNAIQGFINGMKSKGSAIWNEATSLAKSAWNAVKKALGEKSPSRVMFGSGINFVQGFINGSHSKSSAIEKNSQELVASAMDAFNKADISDNKFSVVPVIDSSKLSSSEGFAALTNLSIPDNISITYKLSNIDSLLKTSVETQKNLYSLLAESNLEIDYDLLGDSVARSLVNSGLYVKMDGGKVMGYIAGEIKDARRQFIR